MSEVPCRKTGRNVKRVYLLGSNSRKRDRMATSGFPRGKSSPLPLRSATSASEERSPSGGGPFTGRRSRASGAVQALPGAVRGPPDAGRAGRGQRASPLGAAPGGTGTAPSGRLRLVEGLGRGEVAQRLPRTRVEAVLHGLHGPVRHLAEVRTLREPLPHQPVHVLVQAALPGVVRAREEEPRAERLGHPGMAGELLAVVRGDRVHRKGAQHAGHGGPDGVRGLPVDAPEQGVFRGTVHQRHQRAAVALAHNGVRLPVADPFLRLNRRLYQIIRKHCGDQGQWEISLHKLHLKSGAEISLRDFRYRLRQFVARWARLWDEEGKSFLGYRPDYDAGRDVLRVRTPPKPTRQIKTFLALPATPDPEMVTIIRTEMPGYDTYPIYEEWRKWTLDADADLRNLGGALRGFCRQKAKQLPDVRPGSREWTRAFREARKINDGTMILLLVDAEGPVRGSLVDHLKARDGWEIHEADQDSIHLMSQVMETWIIADQGLWAMITETDSGAMPCRKRLTWKSSPRPTLAVC